MLKKALFTLLGAAAMTVSVAEASAAETIYWTDWLGGDGQNAQGSITSPTSTVSVDYSNERGYAFLQTGDGTNYFADRARQEIDASSPYTSALVDNAPTASEMVALRYAGSQTLSFSEAIANPVFSYVSLNGNGYAFDQDFEILSVGGVDDNACGFWGCGTSYKEVVDLGDGNFEYRLLGTGEPHGTIRFNGAFDSVSWRSLSNEYWNGFTVGVQGTAEEVFAQGCT